ncbi:ABC transporter ATP-binding protein [Solitalea canadensis]|uniref:ATPase component of various ABC-type transport systems with duplicated ATPase domain n=1 Tax=Solitalea canadensis (strain ATCC 29591 / DSM 3403 / JCM 21819 / LMG 8368 / NBRC 15130 / NCIMB 12057 / USAM 9D) TaxID=929556 RepID=H8KVD0_SOLCM|nr:ABC transporter ATP-binding protein [Solitalea canadensis]AFD06310.1 ATPase component of various ABC-type transport systems with duplicated ATPase domain [Solitalea canadensis DSM 3403]
MSETILQVKELSTRFKTEDGWVTAVQHINFSLNKGEVIGIVGESGSGKSVTSLSIMQLIERSNGKNDGEILYTENGNTVDLLKLSEEEIRNYRGNKIAMIFQEPMTSLNPVYTLGDQVAEAIRLHQKVDKETARKKTIELFNEVQLPRAEQLFDSYPHQVSGGQKQRVMIAMALSCNPQLLIADEPTTALDVTVQKTIIELLRKLKNDRGMSMIFISHDLGLVSEISDKVVVMYKGQIMEQGNAEQVFSNPHHPYTKGLLACRPSANLNLKKLPTVTDFMQVQEDGSIKETSLDLDKVNQQFGFKVGEKEKRLSEIYSREPLLKLNSVKTWFPIKKGIFSKAKEYVKAVDDITFNVYPGETLGLVGESGCGKTTLGRSILRLVEPTGGEILFNGENMRDLSANRMRELRKDVQIIFQDPYSSLNPRLTVGNSIMEPMQVHKVFKNDKEQKDRVMELLRRVNLKEEHFNRYPHEFSGGQRQRICIARALALNPKFIICDESVSALDVSVQAQVLNLLVELREEFNLTYIFISHDLSVVRFISDRMVVMNKGRIEEMGDADQVYNHPQQEYTKRLIDAIPKGKMLSV